MALPTSTSYLSVADADAYFAGSFNAAAWAAIPDADKAIALAEATKWLETLCWGGEKCDAGQPLAWPRVIEAAGCCSGADCSALPPALVQATAELALALYQDQTAIIGGGGAGASTTQLVRRQKLGDLEIEYQAPSAGTVSASRYGPNAPLLLQKFPWLGDLLSECYMQGSFGTSRIIGRVRS